MQQCLAIHGPMNLRLLPLRRRVAVDTDCPGARVRDECSLASTRAEEKRMALAGATTPDVAEVAPVFMDLGYPRSCILIRYHQIL